MKLKSFQHRQEPSDRSDEPEEDKLKMAEKPAEDEKTAEEKLQETIQIIQQTQIIP
jgi:hypothetical protein